MGGAEQAGGQEANMEMWRLADGADVPSSAAISTILSLEVTLGKYGAIAAVDLDGLAKMRQPSPTSLYGDLRPTYVMLGLCKVNDEGSIRMHDFVVAVVRNSLHVNPRNKEEVCLVDPRTPFEGFA